MALSELETRARLEQAITTAGGVRKLADLIGVSAPLISDMRKGRRAITVAVVAHLGLRRIVHVIVSYVEAA